MVEGDRRKVIVQAYAALPHISNQTDQCVHFVKRVCRCRSISHFLDSAKDSNVERLERMLNVRV